MRDWTWSPTEKAVARKAFNLALDRKLEQIMHETRTKATKITQPADPWKLEHYLAACRKRIDGKYDYRYSVLPMVFGQLLREGRLTEQDLEGWDEHKRDCIRMLAEF